MIYAIVSVVCAALCAVLTLCSVLALNRVRTTLQALSNWTDWVTGRVTAHELQLIPPPVSYEPLSVYVTPDTNPTQPMTVELIKGVPFNG